MKFNFKIPVLIAVTMMAVSGLKAQSCWYDRGYDIYGNPVSWTVGGSCDDCFMGGIPLGFDFNLYGVAYDSVWMNSNGNITFQGGYNVYTPSPFPNTLSAMVAPFYADVDVRGSGIWSYYIDSSEGYAIFSWEDVKHYYGPTASLRNSFQVIITNGSRPDLTGPGNNSCFNYGYMEWTTGTASGGTGGFGGVPAFVGINQGDGFTGFEYGTFDAPGAAYDGPGGSVDEVDHLDTTCFCYDAVTGSLPVVLADYQARVNENHEVEVRWSTATETNNAYFILERAGEDLQFHEIGRIKGAGDAIQAKHYQYLDPEPLKGTNYYRLTQVDFDGAFETFGTLTVEVNEGVERFNLVEISPVPVTETTTITLTSDNDDLVTANLVDMSGRIVKSITQEVKPGYNDIELDLREVEATGVYLLTIDKSGEHLQTKLIKN